MVQWALTRGNFDPKGTFKIVWRHFLLYNLEGGLLLEFYVKPEMSKHLSQKITWPYNINSAKVEKPCARKKRTK